MKTGEPQNEGGLLLHAEGIGTQDTTEEHVITLPVVS